MHSGENRRCREADAMEEVTRRMDAKCCGNVYEKPSNGIQWPPRPQFHVQSQLSVLNRNLKISKEKFQR